MLKPLQIIDRQATEIARNLEIVVYSLEGLFEITARDNPTYQGLQWFWVQGNDVVARAMSVSLGKIATARDELATTLSTPEREYLEKLSVDASDAETLYTSIGAFLAQAKVTFARRLREIIAARAFGHDTYNSDPRMMTRTGRRWSFSEYAYLMARQALVEFYNETKIGYMAAMGVKEFMLLTEDPTLIDTVLKVEEYPELVETLFHPRTTKLVGGPYVSS